MSSATTDKTAFIVNAWYQGAWWLPLLLPFTLLYWLVIKLRALSYNLGLKSVYRAPVPVVVVGNITVGGTGKSPVVIALVELCNKLGLKPGVVSRGYGSKAASYPLTVTLDTDPATGGDEPVMIALATQVPVVISPNRAEAIELLVTYGCDIVIADDGLQHHAMARDIEVVVMDASRQLGNGLLLPMGPLREPRQRLDTVDFCIENGEKIAPGHYAMQLQPQHFIHMQSGQSVSVAEFAAKYNQVHAVTGIGNPQRFFSTLNAMDVDTINHAFPDHHAFTEADFNFADDMAVVMTAKDAVKVKSFAKPDYFYLAVTANIEAPFYTQFEQALRPFLETDSP